MSAEGSPISDGVERWLLALDAELAGWGALRREVVVEFEDGLRTAVEAQRRCGLTQADAEAAAIAEFGPPDRIARELVPELAATRSRHTAITLVCTGPLVGLVWLGALAAGPPTWPSVPRLVVSTLSVVPLLPVAIAGTLIGAAVVVAASGPAGPVLQLPLRAAPLAAALVCTVVMAGDLILLATFAARLVATPSPQLGLLSLASVCSFARLAFSWRARRRCLRARVGWPRYPASRPG